MHTLKKYTLALLFLLPLTGFAQFPTGTGTIWQYFQYFDDIPHRFAVSNAFRDEIVGDTTIQGQTWHKVERTGSMFEGYPPSYDYVDMDGSWFFRVEGDSVWALDSVVGAQVYEAILYDFSLDDGDTLGHLPQGIVEQTRDSSYFSAPFCCSFGDSSICTQPYYLDRITTVFSGWGRPGLGIRPMGASVYQKNIGMVKESPFIIVLDVYGQHLFLGTLTDSAGQVLYEHDSLSVGFEREQVVDFKVYPNPAQAGVWVEFQEIPTAMRLIDLQGKLVQEVPVEVSAGTRQKLDVSMLPGGVYLIEARFRAGVGREKLIIW